MTASPAGHQRSPLLLFAVLGVAAMMVFVAFASQDDASLGGPGDPLGTGPDGLGALRLMIEESGGSAGLGVSVPGEEYDISILATGAYVDRFAEFDDRPDQTESNYEPILDWVSDGGVLVSGLDVPGGPAATFEFIDDETVTRATCDLAGLDGVEEVRPLDHARVIVDVQDRSCFGDGEEALIVERRVGSGRIVRLAGIGIFSNRALDDADNGALAARVLGLGPGRRVAFLSGPDRSLPSAGGPVNDDGDPVGAGDRTLLELIPTRVVAMLVGLAVASLLYALARGRRLGSPVEETTPILLPSSSFVEAVGRLQARAENPHQRSAEILRSDFRSSTARRVGMSPTATGAELAIALAASSEERTSITTLLDGPTPTNDLDLVGLAVELNARRQRMERGGVAELVARAHEEPRPNDRREPS